MKLAGARSMASRMAQGVVIEPEQRPLPGSRRPRVAVVPGGLPPDFGGGALRAYRFARRLLDANMLAYILAEKRSSPSSAGVEIPPELRIPPDKILRVSPTHRRDATKSVVWEAAPYLGAQIAHAGSIARHVAARRDFDILHCFGPSWLSLYAIGVARAFGKPTVLEMSRLGLDDPESMRTGDHLPLRGRFRHWLYRNADIFVSRSPAMTEACTKAGLVAPRVCEVANAVDVTRFFPPTPEDRATLRRKLDLPESSVVLLFVGSMTPRKGVDLLLRAFERSVKERPPKLLLLVGPAGKSQAERAFAEQLVALAGELGVHDRLRFIGLVNNVEDYMRAGDALLFASESEGLPNVVLEAMASGLPVIMSRLHGVSDYLITSGADGLVVDRTVEALAEGIRRISGDQSFRIEIGAAAARCARARFAPAVIDQAYRGIYDKLLAHGGRGGERKAGR
jgi:glycosyltransferase involved in cell wall biosynthesis